MKYLGIDWATKEHVVALVDDDGVTLDVWSIAHSWAALSALLQRLEDEGGASQIVIGIEPGAPRVTEALAASGYTVYEINPMSADRFRDRSSPAGSKDDRRDAIVLAGAVRTDRGRMRPWRASDELTTELRIRCRDRLMLVDTRRRLLQQLGRTLAEYYPAILALDMELWRPFVRALLRAYPSPREAQAAQRRRLARLLRTHRVTRVDVETLRGLLREETFPISAGAEAALCDRTRWIVDQLEQVQAALAEAQASIAALFEEHPDREILTSLPGIGTTLAPYLAAEITSSLGARPAPRALQATAGTAPRTRKSGRQVRGYVGMRRACHRGLQAALYTAARCSRAKSAWAKAYYREARARGASHNMALRALSNKWAKIIATLLTSRETYDERRHLEDLRRNAVPWAVVPTTGEAA